MSGSTSVAANAAGIPGYTTAWTESFDNGAGSMSRWFGPGVDFSVSGQVTVWTDPNNADSGIMVPPTGREAGFGYGLYSFTLETVGHIGTYALLWPSTDTWPGPELDLVEIDFNGNPYSAVHWDDNGENAANYFGMPDVDETQVHTYSLKWEPGRLTMYVDGVEKWTTTEQVPLDAAHGGENLSPGFGTQTFWNNGSLGGQNHITVYEVSYAKPDAGGVVDPPGGLTLNGTSGADVLKGGALADAIAGLGGDDQLSGNGGDDSIQGGDGRDTLYGHAGKDSLSGGAGNDALRGGAGDDLLATGAGTDRILFGVGDGNDIVSDFALGTDRVQLVGVTASQVVAKVATIGGASGLQLALPGGETLFLQGVGAATAAKLGISGSFAAGSSVPGTGTGTTPSVNLVNGGAGDDWLKGTAGADSLSGGAGSDDLQGFDGNDILRGGADHDGLTGGAGADTFVFARGDGNDWVVDFTPGTDKLRLEGISAAQVTQAVKVMPWSETVLQLSFGNGEDVLLAGVTKTLATTDLIFA